MSENLQTGSEIDEIIERTIEQNPQAAELLKAFGPIIAKQRQLSTTSTLKRIDYSRVDKDKLKAGVPVIRQIDLLGEPEDLKEVTLSLARAVKEGIPSLSEGMDRLSDLVQSGKIKPADCFKSASPGESDVRVDDWVQDLKVSPPNASFLMNLVSRVILEQRARETLKTLGTIDWEKGYCPICGDFPSIARIEEQGGKRFLHCSSCGHDWLFTRVVCPYCEKDASTGMDYFYLENKTQESAFICDQCRKYLVTLYRAGQLLARDMDVSAISLVYLDMIMQKKGYEPMTVCLWNVFD